MVKRNYRNPRTAAHWAAVVFATLLSGLPVAAEAHAILLEASPAQNATVQGPELAVRFRYNSRVDKKFSRLVLTKPDKTQTTLSIDPGSPEDELDSSIIAGPGLYSLRWQVLAVDGHITRGDVRFTIARPDDQAN